MISQLALVVLVHATVIVAGLVVWFVAVGQHTVSFPVLARAALIGPAAITVQMLAYGALGVRFGLFSILGPWWLLCVWVGFRTRPKLDLAVPRVLAEWFAVGIAGAQLVVVLAVVTSGPVFMSDAMFNFALPAKVYALSGGLSAEPLRALADPGNLHYPPLLPLNESLFFLIDAEHGASWIQLLFPLAMLAFLILAAEVVWDRRRPWLSLLCFGTIAATPQISINSIGGFVDLRLCASLLLVVIEVAHLNERRDGALAALVLATVTCALTKREGYVIAAAVAVVLWTCRRRLGLGGRRTAAALCVIAGLSLPWPIHAELANLPSEYSAIIASKLSAHAVDLISPIFVRLAELTVGKDAGGYSRWGCLWLVALAIGGYRAFIDRDRGARWTLVCLTSHMLLIATALAILSEQADQMVSFVLDSTADRLLLQMLPWLVVLMNLRRSPGLLGTSDCEPRAAGETPG